MPPSNEMDRELQHLEAELKRLEKEYNMYFAGRLQRPPWDTRKQVETIVKRLDRAHIPNYGDRFRFTTLQSRFHKFIDLWDRALRAREEGRPGPLSFGRKAPKPQDAPPPPPQAFTTSLSDPVRELDKLRDLYDSLAEARRQVGQENVPFHKFAELVKAQVAQLKQKGSAEVRFRVAVKDGKVAFTARGTKSKE